jgi:hypothetical protein
MDSFVAARNNCEARELRRVLTLSKTRPSHAARYSFLACGDEATGLKTYRGPKRKEQPGRVYSGLQLSFTSPIGHRLNRLLDFKELRGLLAGDRVLMAPVFGPLPANRNLRDSAN